MTFAIDKWKKNGWKVALWSMLGLLAIKFAIWPLLQSAYLKASSVGQAKKGAETGLWNDFLAAWPYTTVALGAMLLFAIVIVVGLRDGKTAGERIKKTLEFCWALGKVLGMLAVVCVFTVFIIGPTKFWGQPMVIQQVPAQGAAQTAAVQTAVYPQSFARIAPIGSINDPPEKWSAPVRVNGRKFTADAKGTKDTMPMAVWADGMVLVVAPGVHPHIASPKEVRFLSLTNVPLEIVGTIE